MGKKIKDKAKMNTESCERFVERESGKRSLVNGQAEIILNLVNGFY